MNGHAGIKVSRDRRRAWPTLGPHPTRSTPMPIRTSSSLNHQIQKNGARLHLATVTRTHSKGVDQPPSEAEQALLEERRSLKAAKAALQAQPKAPKPQPAWMTKEPKAPPAPKAAKVAKEPKAAKAADKGNKPTRAEKLTKKAENLDAAKKATKKSAKT
ncbi:MAG: hypothetical protein ABL916_24155 [Burkholderiaceae bacterium]